jgi:hypothetical protein
VDSFLKNSGTPKKESGGGSIVEPFISSIIRTRSPTFYFFLVARETPKFLFVVKVHYLTAFHPAPYSADSTVSKDAGIEPRTVASLTLAVRRSGQY